MPSGACLDWPLSSSAQFYGSLASERALEGMSSSLQIGEADMENATVIFSLSPVEAYNRQ
jgi:hypothetical protein